MVPVVLEDQGKDSRICPKTVLLQDVLLGDKIYVLEDEVVRRTIERN